MLNPRKKRYNIEWQRISIHYIFYHKRYFNMRYSRQDKILEIITEYEIETQDALAEKLAENGFNVTQATISRDIKELQLIKTQSSSGRYKYTRTPQAASVSPGNRFHKIFKNTVSSIASSGNIIVVRTLSGCANAAGEAIDSLGIDGILGSLAGDNTVFVVVDSPEHVSGIVSRFSEIMGV